MVLEFDFVQNYNQLFVSTLRIQILIQIPQLSVYATVKRIWCGYHMDSFHLWFVSYFLIIWCWDQGHQCQS